MRIAIGQVRNHPFVRLEFLLRFHLFVDNRISISIFSLLYFNSLHGREESKIALDSLYFWLAIILILYMENLNIELT